MASSKTHSSLPAHRRRHRCGKRKHSLADLVFGTLSGNYTRAYDAEHQLLTHPYSTYNTPSNRPDCSGNDTDDGIYTATQTYKWGPNGHPLQMNGETLHWDGDQLLYTSNASGTVDNVKAGKLADIDPSKSKMIVLDRDLGGVVVSTHNNEGFSGWNPPDPYGQRCVAGPPPSSPAYASAYVNTPFAKISELAVDGITDGNNVIQGRRAYDAKTGQWTSPDQLAGTATYPLSQKPYVWNADNELAFSDPGGNQVFPPTGEPPMLPSPFPPRSLPEAIVDRAFGDVLGGFTGLALGAIGFGVGCAITACTGGEFFGAGIGFATGFGVGYYGAEWIVHEAFNGMYPSSSGTGSDFGNPDSFGQGGSWTSFGIPQAGSAISIAPGDYHTTYYGDGSTLYYNPPYDPTAVTVHGPTGDVTLQPGESAGFSASGLSSSFLTGVANNNALMSNDPMAYVHQSSFL
ncbi:MAG: hypothetical protein M3Z35_16745 [Nitrospirota bacterium]|nr:hypothetical protein [Nitrospirota bacterium]